MALRSEYSIMGGLATAAIVYAIYSNATPTMAEIRTTAPMNPDIDASERAASWTAAGVVAGISLIAKDPTIFIIGSGMVVAMAWWHRHSNMVNPDYGRAVPNAQPTMPDAAMDGYEAMAA